MPRSLLLPRISEQFSRDKDGEGGNERERMERSKERKDQYARKFRAVASDGFLRASRSRINVGPNAGLNRIMRIGDGDGDR